MSIQIVTPILWALCDRYGENNKVLIFQHRKYLDKAFGSYDEHNSQQLLEVIDSISDNFFTELEELDSRARIKAYIYEYCLEKKF